MKLVGVALRNYKCYGSTETVPLFFENERFTGLIGENGVGKSAVLEGLASFFTGRNWIRNKITKAATDQCGIAPIVWCVEGDLGKGGFEPEEIKKLRKYSKEIKKTLTKQITVQDDGLYLSCLYLQNNDTNLFDGSQKVTGEDALGEKVRHLFLSSIKYVYVGAEVDIDTSANINSETTEFIKGSGAVNEITKILRNATVKPENKEISVTKYINEIVISYLENDVVRKLQEVDRDYNYKNLRTGAQSNLSDRHIAELAAQSLFGNRELTKRIKTKDIGISDMSSGQRRKAFLDFIIVMISNLGSKEQSKVILAIDEPEISVDAGSRIQQFDKLMNLTKDMGVHVAFTTHWYGWIAQTTGGNAVLFQDNEEGRQIIASQVDDFLTRDAQKKVPYEMRMMFDFLASLGAWSESDKAKKFILCEGRTDQNYITTHFEGFKVVPLRGRDEVIRLYKIFSDYYLRVDRKPENIVFLIDTDPEKAAELRDAKEKNLKRISRDSNGKIKIVSRDENYSEKCAVEDLLSPRPFLEAMQVTLDMLTASQADFIRNLNIKYDSETGLRAFGLDAVEQQRMKEIFKVEGFKQTISERYNPNELEKQNFVNLLQL